MMIASWANTEEVLARPELHIPPPRVLAVIDHIELAGKFVTPKLLPTEGYPDPDDIMFAEVFITSNADALITGNLKHSRYAKHLACGLPGMDQEIHHRSDTRPIFTLI